MKKTPRWLLKDLDPHVIGITISPAILALILPFNWLVYLVALIPQGRIITRATDYTNGFKRSPAAYLIVNETIVALAVAMILHLRG